MEEENKVVAGSYVRVVRDMFPEEANWKQRRLYYPVGTVCQVLASGVKPEPGHEESGKCWLVLVPITAQDSHLIMGFVKKFHPDEVELVGNTEEEVLAAMNALTSTERGTLTGNTIANFTRSAIVRVAGFDLPEGEVPSGPKGFMFPVGTEAIVDAIFPGADGRLMLGVSLSKPRSKFELAFFKSAFYPEELDIIADNGFQDLSALFEAEGISSPEDQEEWTAAMQENYGN